MYCNGRKVTLNSNLWHWPSLDLGRVIANQHVNYLDQRSQKFKKLAPLKLRPYGAIQMCILLLLLLLKGTGGKHKEQIDCCSWSNKAVGNHRLIIHSLLTEYSAVMMSAWSSDGKNSFHLKFLWIDSNWLLLNNDQFLYSQLTSVVWWQEGFVKFVPVAPKVSLSEQVETGATSMGIVGWVPSPKLLVCHNGLMVTCLTAVSKDPGSNLTMGSCVYHDSHCNIQPWARAAHHYRSA